MIQILDDYYRSADGIHQIHVRWHIPDSPRAVVRLCHGMCEYIARYDAFAEFLAQNGYAVCGNDHLGHGLSVDDGRFGYFSEKNGMLLLLEDTHTLGRLAAERFPGLPQFLLGHSMGSLIAREYVAEYEHGLSACIFCGTLGPLAAPDLCRALAGTICALHGPMKVSGFIQRASFGSYLDRIKNPKTIYDWVCTDEAVSSKYAVDPFCTYRFTNSAMRDLIGLYGKVSKKKWAARLPKDLPIMLISGTEDPCGNYGKGVEDIFLRIRAAGVKEVSLKLYPDVRHEILNDRSKEEVYADVLSFFTKHLTEEAQ